MPIPARQSIPRATLAVASEVLSATNSAESLRTLLIRAGASGDEPDGSSKAKRCRAWLEQTNDDQATEPLCVLGRAIEELMDRTESEQPSSGWLRDGDSIPHVSPKDRLLKQMKADGLQYFRGGRLSLHGITAPLKSLSDRVRNDDFVPVQHEFDRALEGVESDPASSVTAACALLESVFKCIIEVDELTMPSDESIMPLWKVVRDHLGFNPKSLEDDDLKKILQGLASIVDGIGSLRTHAGSAHGRGVKAYRIEPRHARLSIHAASTLATFVLETRLTRKSVRKYESNR